MRRRGHVRTRPGRRPSRRGRRAALERARTRGRAARTWPRSTGSCSSAAPTTSSTPTTSRSSRTSASSRWRRSTAGSRSWASASARRSSPGRSTPTSARPPPVRSGSNGCTPNPLRRRSTPGALPRRRHGLPVAHGHVRATRRRRAARDGRSGSQPGFPRRGAHLGRAVAPRDRPTRARVLAGHVQRRRHLAIEWGNSTGDVRAEADMYLAAHEVKGRELFARFVGVVRETAG